MRLFSLRTAAHYDRASWPLRTRLGQVDPYMLPAYRWMARQLSARVGPPPRGAEGPIWAWVVRPDLRSAGLMPRGTPTVLRSSTRAPCSSRTTTASTRC